MKRLLLAALAAILPTAALAADLPAAVQASLLAAAPARLDIRRGQLPPGARKAHPIIANAGEPFQATDAVGPGENLPGQRIVWGARAGGWYVLQTEFGGIAHGWALELFDASRPAEPAAWKAYNIKPMPRWSDFRAALAARRIVWGGR